MAEGQRVEWADTESRVLLNAVEEFQVAFLPEFGQAWQDEWDSTDNPALVRLSIKANERHWPDLVLRVHR